MLDSTMLNVATDPGLRVSEAGDKATLKSGAFELVFRTPWISAEEAYAPPATPTRRTRINV